MDSGSAPGGNRMIRSGIIKTITGCVVFALATAGVFAAPGRVTAKPVDKDVIKIYSYPISGLVSMDEANPGFLVELARTIVHHPDLPVEIEVSPVAVLMKYSLIQAVGVSAIGQDRDFSARDLQDLVGIVLYEKAGKTYKLYFNMLNPRSKPLYESTLEAFERARRDGTFERLVNKYNLN